MPSLFLQCIEGKNYTSTIFSLYFQMVLGVNEGSAVAVQGFFLRSPFFLFERPQDMSPGWVSLKELPEKRTGWQLLQSMLYVEA